MTVTRKYPAFFVFFFSIAFLLSCNNGDAKKSKPIADTTRKTIKKEIALLPEKKFESPPIINIVDTLAPKRTVIYCSDSAANFDRIALKLGNIYGGKLTEYIKKNNLKVTGATMAWYKKEHAPWFFDAGIPVNKKGAKTVANVHVRELAAGKVILAHFYGPYELLPQGYTAIKDFIKDNKKVAAGSQYEIYVTDPVDKNGKAVNPYKVQTDIVFPIK